MDRNVIRSFFRKLSSFQVIAIFWVAVYAINIGQDYLFSYIRNSSFYWSEALLFNFYWLFFIPLLHVLINVFEKLKQKKLKSLQLGGTFLMLSTILSFCHVIFFSAVIAILSNIFFQPPHPFRQTLLASISNDSIVTILIYVCFSFYLIWKSNSVNEDDVVVKKYKTMLSVKKGNKFVLIDVQDIVYIESNRPYTSIYTDKGMHLMNQSLGKIEEVIDPFQFLRIHKSTIVNKNAVKEIISRQNGDYDLILENMKELRMSRHYRKNWESLIMPSA